MFLESLNPQAGSAAHAQSSASLVKPPNCPGLEGARGGIDSDLAPISLNPQPLDSDLASIDSNAAPETPIDRHMHARSSRDAASAAAPTTWGAAAVASAAAPAAAGAAASVASAAMPAQATVSASDAAAGAAGTEAGATSSYFSLKSSKRHSFI